MNLPQLALLASIAAAALLAACGGDAGSDDPASSLIALAVEPVGPNCAFGGTRADAGTDSDRNRTLDASEITSTSYVCRASAGTVTVSGPSAQAASNTGYVADSPAQVALTLPASPSIGDTLTVTGAGLGGWKLVQNPGQTIRTRGLPGSPAAGAFSVTAAGQQDWWSLATSSDGRIVVASTNGATNGLGAHLNVSRDYGATWTDITPSSDFSEAYVAMSPDGTRIVYAIRNGAVWTSVDGGKTWGSTSPTSAWIAVAMSSDGANIVAVEVNGQIHQSVDAGATWSPKYAMPGPVAGVAMSSNGQVISAVGLQGMWSSTDSGASWHSNGGGYGTVAMSSNGAVIAATYWGGGPVYVTTDTFLHSRVEYPGEYLTGGAYSGAYLAGIASSADGERLVAVSEYGTGTYMSSDSGVHWTKIGGTDARGVALSANGDVAYTATSDGHIWIERSDRTTVGTSGSLAGWQGDAATLQYVGEGVWVVLNHTSNSGSFTVL